MYVDKENRLIGCKLDKIDILIKKSLFQRAAYFSSVRYLLNQLISSVGEVLHCPQGPCPFESREVPGNKKF